MKISQAEVDVEFEEIKDAEMERCIREKYAFALKRVPNSREVWWSKTLVLITGIASLLSGFAMNIVNPEEQSVVRTVFVLWLVALAASVCWVLAQNQRRRDIMEDLYQQGKPTPSESKWISENYSRLGL